MKIWKRFAILATVAMALTMAPVAAQDKPAEKVKPKKVGKVLAITGQRLMTSRNTEGHWYQGYEGMPGHLKERFKTDAETQAVVEFFIGGQAIIKPGTEIEIVGDREAKTTGNELIVRAGTIWAKVDKQNSEFKIKTAGGTMGIEGTEFVIDVNDEGETKLSVLEGAVRYTDRGGKQQLASPGDRVVAGAATALTYNHVGVWNLREALREEHPELARASYFLGSYVPGFRIMGGREAYYARRALQAFQDPEGAAFDLVADEVGSQVGHGLGGLIRRAKPKPAQPVSNLKWEQDNDNDAPRFSWKKTKAHEYATLVAKDSKGTDIVWAGKTQDDNIKYPTFGPALEARSYYLFVIPMNDEGKPVANKNGPLGKSRSFRSKVFTPTLQAIASTAAKVSPEAPKPEITWQSVDNAGEYRVDISTDAAFNDVMWSGRAKGTSINYPAEARPLDAGTYFVRVTAFDETGYRMAESAPVEFAAADTWKSLGVEVATPPTTLVE